MRKKEKEITDKKVIEEILSGSQICRIGLVDNGAAYIVPVNYGYSSNALYIHSAPEGKKIDLIKLNNTVCFEIEYGVEVLKNDSPCKWSTKYRSVIGYGTVEIITDEEEKKRGLDIIMFHHGRKEKNIYNESELKRMIILKISIDRMQGKQSADWN